MKKIAIFVDEIYEDLELWYPKIRLEEAGAETIVIGGKKDHFYMGKHGYPCQSQKSFDQANAADLDGIVIPGGYAPDKIRRIGKAIDLVKQMHAAEKMIAFICHGGWVPISAKVLKEVQVTGTDAIKDDLENAGAIWNDKELVVDGHFISSRNPGDLPAFGKAIVDFLGL
ncbi:MAG: type 1 glutamine amidotransferase domain-containing protein [Simkaniaceae bacterium]